MRRTWPLMSDPHQQDKRGDGTKPTSERGILLKQLEVDHWGVEAQHPKSLPSAWQAKDSGCGQQRRKIRHSTILDLSGADRKWATAQSDGTLATLVCNTLSAGISQQVILGGLLSYWEAFIWDPDTNAGKHSETCIRISITYPKSSQNIYLRNILWKSGTIEQRKQPMLVNTKP